MNDNTVLRIKVPAHLYESVKEQLTLKEAKSNKAFGDWKVVKEKKLPKEKKATVEDMKDGKKIHSLAELKAVKEKLEKKIHEMENNPKVEEKEKVNEVGAGVEYAWIPGALGAAAISATVIKNILAHMKKNKLTGMKGFIQAYQEVGKDASSTIDQKMSGGLEETKDKEKKEEDK